MPITGGASAAEQIKVVLAEGGYPPFYMDTLQAGMVIDFLLAFEQATPEFDLVFEGLPRKRVDLVIC